MRDRVGIFGRVVKLGWIGILGLEGVDCEKPPYGFRVPVIFDAPNLAHNRFRLRSFGCAPEPKGVTHIDSHTHTRSVEAQQQSSPKQPNRNSQSYSTFVSVPNTFSGFAPAPRLIPHPTTCDCTQVQELLVCL
jgi:hypothetical protein